MGLLNNFLSFTLFSLFIHSTYALYFHIGETERKCFIEEIPDETTVLGKLGYSLFVQSMCFKLL